MSRLCGVFCAILLLLPIPSLCSDKKKESPCDKPPVLISPPPSKEELKRARKIRAQGLVEFAVSEDGEVTEAKVIRASSQEAADMLLKRTKAMKFQPRPECGTFRTAANYTLE